MKRWRVLVEVPAPQDIAEAHRWLAHLEGCQGRDLAVGESFALERLTRKRPR
jgi:hypothetical protein